MKLEFSRQNFKKYSNIKSNESPASGSRVVSCGRADMTKLLVACRNFANAPKMGPEKKKIYSANRGETGNASVIFPSTC